MLTPRELRVLELRKQGLTTREIAAKLNLTPLTVQNYRTSLRRKQAAQRPHSL